MKILITGGAGFIGSALIRRLVAHSSHEIINVDCLTYASSYASLASVAKSPRYHFEKIDICDLRALSRAIANHRPDGIIHLAAESHVDRSIANPESFIQTNVVGTYRLLSAAYEYYASLTGAKRRCFKFHHVSTDEVYGPRVQRDTWVAEGASYAPSSPYSASKASADHLVHAWGRTYGLPVVVSHGSNTYGPFQQPDKLVPHMLMNALQSQPLPIYGDGSQRRDWLHVEDHARALHQVFVRGRIGEGYNIATGSDVSNRALVEILCAELQSRRPRRPHGDYTDLITYVGDRPGHDSRYGIKSTKIESELGWRPSVTLREGLGHTIQWYLDNSAWLDACKSG